MKKSTEATIAKKAVIVTAVALAMAAVVAFCWIAAQAVLLIFAGLLLAAVVDALSLPLRKARLPVGLSRVIVVLVLFALIGGGLWYSGATIVQQFNELRGTVETQLTNLADMLNEAGINIGKGATSLRDLLPSANGIVSSAPKAVFTILGVIGDVFVSVFIALFVVAQPSIYRRGVVSLFPHNKRRRIDETIRAAAWELVLWLGGTGISMATVFVVTWIGLALIGMPSAFLLAVQAGVLAFIPTLGPFAAGIPIVLAGISVSPSMAVWGLGVYVAVQGVESYGSQPIAQRYTSALPPALTLGAQLVFGVLFGLLGVVLAVPLVAVLMVFVKRLYIEDTLGGPYTDSDTGSDESEAAEA